MYVVAFNPSPRENRFDFESYDAFERIRDLAAALELALEGAVNREMIDPRSPAVRLCVLAGEIGQLAGAQIGRLDEGRSGTETSDAQSS